MHKSNLDYLSKLWKNINVWMLSLTFARHVRQRGLFGFPGEPTLLAKTYLVLLLIIFLIVLFT